MQCFTKSIATIYGGLRVASTNCIDAKPEQIYGLPVKTKPRGQIQIDVLAVTIESSSDYNNATPVGGKTEWIVLMPLADSIVIGARIDISAGVAWPAINGVIKSVMAVGGLVRVCVN